ncbi:MAG: hypothetical protein ABFD92_21735 [Planctomycetaceae bacterium]|nr:hypothetical protein [Planctomycetaceae bacterium]
MGVVIFDPFSGIIIQCRKKRTIEINGKQVTPALVLKKHPRSGTRSFLTRLPTRSVLVKGVLKVKIMPRWMLPAWDGGEILEQVECGPSIFEVQDAVRAMITDDPALRDQKSFHVWAHFAGFSGMPFFQDEYKATDDKQGSARSTRRRNPDEDDAGSV